MAHHLARRGGTSFGFAAEMTVQGRGKLREQRRAFIAALKELKRRWPGVDTCLRASQPEPL